MTSFTFKLDAQSRGVAFKYASANTLASLQHPLLYRGYMSFFMLPIRFMMIKTFPLLIDPTRDPTPYANWINSIVLFEMKCNVQNVRN